MDAGDNARLPLNRNSRCKNRYVKGVTVIKQASKNWMVGLLSLPYLMLAGAAQAFVAPNTAVQGFTADDGIKIGIRTLRPELVQSTESSFRSLADGGEADVKSDSLSGAPRLITGTLLYAAALELSSDEAAFAALAAQYIANHGDTLGIKYSDLRLNKNATMIATDGQFISYKVLRNGIEIQDASIDFRFKGGKLVQIANRSYGEAGISPGDGLADTQEIAQQTLAGSSVAKSREVYRVIATNDGYQLVKVAEFNSLTADNKVFKVQVETVSGQIFEVRPTEFHFSGSGHASGDVYQRTYYKEAAVVLPYRDLTINAGSATLITDVNGAFSNVPNGTSPTTSSFIGPFVRVTPANGAPVALKAGPEESGQWALNFHKGSRENATADQAMAQSMTFYHLNKEIQHAKRFISNRWLESKLTANVNLSQTCNAYWNGTSVNLFSAGGGCANTALIADVFYHEWGHGLHDNTSGIDDGAYSEGFSDACSLMMTRGNEVGPGFKTPSGAPVRDLATLKVYPKDKNLEIHAQGLIIGGAFWDLFKSLKNTYAEDKAVDVLSNLLLKMISTTHHYTDTYDAIVLLDSATGDLTKASPNFCAINAAFTRHGLATADTTRCLADVAKD